MLDVFCSLLFQLTLSNFDFFSQLESSLSVPLQHSNHDLKLNKTSANDIRAVVNFDLLNRRHCESLVPVSNDELITIYFSNMENFSVHKNVCLVTTSCLHSPK